MNLSLALDVCTAVHVGALMAWFGPLALSGAGFATPVNGGARRLAGAVALGAGVLWPFLQTGVVTDDASAAWDPDQVSVVLAQTSFGRTWMARECVLAVALIVEALPVLAGGRSVAFLVALVLASMALLGHAGAATGAAGIVGKAAIALHLLAGGAWLGALPVLWNLTARGSPADIAVTLRRFSPYGLTLVAMVLASGTLSACMRLDAPADLIGTAYGRILLIKVGLVFLMGLAALNNRNRLTPALGGAGDVEPVRAALRRSIGLEAALGAAVLVAAALLGSAESPR